MAPDSATSNPSLPLEHQHVCDQRPVVAKAIGTRQSLDKEVSLNPAPTFVVEVGKLPVVSIRAPSAIRETDRAPQG